MVRVQLGPKVVGRLSVVVSLVVLSAAHWSCSSDKRDGDGQASGGSSSAAAGAAAAVGGRGSSTSTGGSGSCSAKTCSTENAECGTLLDGCGQTLECGTCTAPLLCGGDGTPNRCTQAYGFTEDTTHGASYDIQALWGSSPNSFWAAAGGGDALGGAGQVHYYDGTGWQLVFSRGGPSFFDLFGVGSEVFVVGAGPQFFQMGTASVIELEGPASMGAAVPNTAVWASAADAVWVGSNSTASPVRFWNGRQFDETNLKYGSPNPSGVAAIWGSAANDVWAADEDGILHFDGQSWTQSDATAPGIRAIHGSGPNDVWAVGPRHLLHYDGQAWSAVPSGANKALSAVWVAGPNDVWLVGDGGSILHGDTTSLAAVESGITQSLYAIWGSSPRDIWAGGEGGVLIHYGPVETPTAAPDAGTENCSPQGYGCSQTPCCPPFRCSNIGGAVFACK